MKTYEEIIRIDDSILDEALENLDFILTPIEEDEEIEKILREIEKEEAC